MGGHGWGVVQEQELVEAVRAALDGGINLFDTADTYGLGQSELTLGRALGADRHKAVIATKFGVRVENGTTFYDNSPRWIRTACENSLRRLGTDYIDLYQIHYRDGKTELSAVMEALEDLRREGKIRYAGISNLSIRDLPELEHWKGSLCTIQNQYSMACRDYEADLVELSDALALTPMTWGSLGQGILTGKYNAGVAFTSDDRRSRDVYVNFHGQKLQSNLMMVEHLREVASRYGKPISAVAVRFILDYLSGSVALCGAKRPDQVLGNAQALGWQLKQKDLAELVRISN
jgi:aryl-alcohol dehydrogenase-like predicted oxidoreductase